MRFTDRIVWITGASSGIGAAVARAFSAAGARCVLSARRESELESVREGCTNPDRHMVLPLDATAFESHAEAADRIRSAFGPVDILVLSAGVSQRGRSWDTDLSVVRKIMDVNYTGSVSLTQAVLPQMKENRRGQIVIVSSLTGRVSTPGRTAYAGSKHAVHGYFNGLRAELHGSGIGVTIVAPGFIRTDISLNALTGSGEPFNMMNAQQEGGMDPDTCAAQILRATSRRKAEVHIGGPERLGVQVFRFFPSLFRALAHRFEPK